MLRDMLEPLARFEVGSYCLFWEFLCALSFYATSLTLIFVTGSLQMYFYRCLKLAVPLISELYLKKVGLGNSSDGERLKGFFLFACDREFTNVAFIDYEIRLVRGVGSRRTQLS